MKHFSFSTIVFIGLLCIVGSSSLSETNKNQHVLDTPGDESISEGKDTATWGNSLRGRDLQRYADIDNENNYYDGIDNENNSDTGDNENNYYYENDTEQNNSNEDEEPEDGDGTNGHGGGNHMHGGYHHQGWRVPEWKRQRYCRLFGGHWCRPYGMKYCYYNGRWDYFPWWYCRPHWNRPYQGPYPNW